MKAQSDQDLQALVDRQRQRMQDLRDDAQDLAEAVADETWDKLETEIENFIGDSYVADTPELAQMFLSSALMSHYNEAFEHHVLGLFTHLSEQLQQALESAGAGSKGFDEGRLGLSGLRKGLRLEALAQSMIGEALRRARPGAGSQIATVFGGLFRSIERELEALDRDMAQAARRAKRELLALRAPLKQRMVEDTRAAIGVARLQYLEALDAAPSNTSRTE